MQGDDKILDVLINRMLGSVSQYSEYLTPGDITLVSAEAPDALPAILTVPNIDCDRAIMALEDHLGLGVPANYFN
jgi:hypothetical protein